MLCGQRSVLSPKLGSSSSDSLQHVQFSDPAEIRPEVVLHKSEETAPAEVGTAGEQLSLLAKITHPP